MSSLTPTLENKLPYLVMNATVVSPEPTGWADGLFEMTPVLVGNQKYGYNGWGAREISYQRAVAISGAAFRGALKQAIENPISSLEEGEIVLDDGGHSENLGAISLIRRGIKNIVIVDAEHNPKYEFEAYKNLKRRLANWGLTLEIPSIDDFIWENMSRRKKTRNLTRLKSAVHVGSVRGGSGEISRIFYVKMSMPYEVSKWLLSADAEILKREWHQNSGTIFRRLKETKMPNGSWDCNAIAEMKIDSNKWMLYNLKSYTDDIDTNLNMKILRSVPFDSDFFYSDFPQNTTGDQSYYIDQSLAFMGLGYLEGQELMQEIEKAH